MFQRSGRVRSLVALSRCQKLACLDLSRIHATFPILDLLRAVSKLSCLKIFHFPWGPLHPSDSEDNDIRLSEKTPKWPSSLVAFHIPDSLRPGYMPAIEMAPASVTSLTLEEDIFAVIDEDIDVMHLLVALLGSRILTFKLEFDELSEAYEDTGLAELLTEFPNLLQLIVPFCFISHVSYTTYIMGLQVDHPLRSITLNVESLDHIFLPDFLDALEHLLDDYRVSGFRSLILSSELSKNCWVSFLRGNPLPVIHIKLFEIGWRLKQRGSSTSDLKKIGVWLVDGEDEGDVACEFT